MPEAVLSLFFPEELTQYFELKNHQKFKDERSGAIILEITLRKRMFCQKALIHLIMKPKTKDKPD